MNTLDVIFFYKQDGEKVITGHLTGPFNPSWNFETALLGVAPTGHFTLNTDSTKIKMWSVDTIRPPRPQYGEILINGICVWKYEGVKVEHCRVGVPHLGFPNCYILDFTYEKSENHLSIYNGQQKHQQRVSAYDQAMKIMR